MNSRWAVFRGGLGRINVESKSDWGLLVFRLLSRGIGAYWAILGLGDSCSQASGESRSTGKRLSDLTFHCWTS